jgi:hypothetical protein
MTAEEILSIHRDIFNRALQEQLSASRGARVRSLSTSGQVTCNRPRTALQEQRSPGFPQNMQPIFPATHNGGTMVNGVHALPSAFMLEKTDRPYCRQTVLREYCGAGAL